MVYYLRNAIFLAIIVSTLSGCGIRNDPVYPAHSVATK
jgi:hypothetical protein